MEDGIQLANRFREVMLNGRWVANTNFKEQLAEVPFAQATTPIGPLNTIAHLAYHIDYYLGGMVRVFEDGPLDIHDKHSFGLPPLASQQAWGLLVDGLLAHAEQFAQHVAGFTPEQLDKTFVDEKYGTYRRNIEGAIEHGYYHLGQVVLIKNLLRHDGFSKGQ